MIYTVTLRDMTFFAHHGLYDFEKQQGNQFKLTVQASRNMPDDATFPDIESTIDYEKIYQAVVPIMAEPEDLLEQVLLKIESSLRAQIPHLHALELTLVKERPPMGEQVKSSEVTLKFSYV